MKIETTRIVLRVCKKLKNSLDFHQIIESSQMILDNNVFVRGMKNGD